MKRKKNQKIWNALKQKQSDYTIKAGWFENSKYDNGTPIGRIAAVQNFGAAINVTDKMRGFFAYKWGIHLKKGTIVIPPTHFMEECQNENKENWRKMALALWAQVFAGKITPDTVAETLGSRVENDIRKKMVDGNYPPVTRFTLMNKLSEYADQKTEGELGKRFQTKEHIMIDSISYQVDKK